MMFYDTESTSVSGKAFSKKSGIRRRLGDAVACVIGGKASPASPGPQVRRSNVEMLESRVMLSAGSVVINEINYNPPDKTKPTEFVELTNPGTTSVDLTGAAFTSGIDYSFPAGTILPAGGYLVISANPTALQQTYGVTSLGPFTGKLSNSGNDLVIEDAAGNTLDEVDYGVGFPWPIIGDSPGPGYSIELINPALDNNLGGNWRSYVPTPATQVTLINSGSPWDYRKGTAEASIPSDVWRNLYYVEDSNWVKNTTAPIGYDPTLAMGTTLSDMNGGYSSVSMRKVFAIPDPAEVLGLTLQSQYDDGFNAWINGHLVASSNTAGENQAYNALATTARENNTFQSFTISPAFLQAHDNVLAIQYFNVATTDNDAFFDAKLIETTGTGGPTPGAKNSVFAANAAPDMRQVTVTPTQPTAGQTVTITTKVTDSDGVASVNLAYQTVDAGSYFPIQSTAYNLPANWTTVAMHDDGLNGDVTAADGIYSYVLPAAVQVNRRLVRYRITSADTLGNTITGPYADDPVPNFAYYVYNGVPSYSAALQPGASGANGTVVTYPASALTSVPYVTLITNQTDHDNAQHIPSGTIPGYTGSEDAWSGTLVYNGVVYDNIHYRARGGVWRYAMGKNMWKIDFENGHDFQQYYPDGTPFPVLLKKLNLGANIQQGDIGMRGEQGLFETLSFQMFNLAGVPAPATQPMALRIVESASATGADQYSTDFQGLYLSVQEMDGRFLDSAGLPDGNLYKMESGVGVGSGSLSNQGPTQPTDNSDLLAFTTALSSNPTDAWIAANVDLQEFYSFQAVVEMIHHWDIGFGKNYFYYHNPTTNKWDILPWDTDLTWYVNYEPTNGDQDPFAKAILSRPAFQLAYRNRVRELRDLLFNSGAVASMIDQYTNLVNPPGGPSIIGADAAMWDYNPIESSSYINLSKATPGRYYLGGSPTKDFIGMATRMKTWAASRFAWIDANVLTLADEAAAPVKPVVAYTGPASFPANQLTFSTTPFTAGNTGGTFAAMQWRIADVTTTPGQAPNYEVNAAWDSGPITTFSSTVTIPSNAVVAGDTYRVRVRMQDSNGRWSHWSTVTFGTTEFIVGTASSIVRDLRLTELNYDPAKPAAGSPYNNDDFEFVEFKNFGSQPLDLTGLKFTDGITYTLPSATLAAGQVGVVVHNTAAFKSRYGSGILILGDYLSTDQSFSNSGEHVEVQASSGVVLDDFTYNVTWYPTTKGSGASLEVINPVIGPDLNLSTSWRASTVTNGTPGVENSIGVTAPSNLVSTAATATQISLQWTDNSGGEQGYLVFRRAAGDLNFSQIASLATNTSLYVDAGLAVGSSYEYRVQAYTATSFSKYASTFAATASAAPTGLSATATPSSGIVTLIWSAVPGALAYNVYRGTVSGGEVNSPIASGVLAPAFVDTGITAGSNYYYVVTSLNSAGVESARSAEASSSIALTGAVIGTTGSFNNSGNTIAKVFDGDITTFFDAPTANGNWVGLDMGSPAVVTSVSFVSRATFASRMVGGVFQVATDAAFTSPVTLYTITAAPTDGIYTTVNFVNSTAYRYVRYLSPTNGYGNVAELVFNGQGTPPSITGTSGNDTIYLKLNPDSVHIDYWLNTATPGSGTATGQIGTSFGLKIHGVGGTDKLTIDQSAGNVLASISTANGIDSTGGGKFTLNVTGTAGIDNLQLDSAAGKLIINGDTLPITSALVSGVVFTDMGANDTVSVTGTIPLTLNLGTGFDILNVSSGANATVNFGSSSGDLTINGSGNTNLVFGSGSPNLQFGSAQPQAITLAPATTGGSISGVVYNDTNGNGVRNVAEKGVSGQKVFLDINHNCKRDAGEPTAVTASDGSYHFKNLAIGTYRVMEVVPAGWRQTKPAAGYYELTVGDNQAITGENFGMTQSVLISGKVYNDANANRVQNSGEAGLGQRTVYIDTNNNGKLDRNEVSTLTDSQGNFAITGLAANSYRIRLVAPSGWRDTTPSAGTIVKLKAGGAATGLTLGQMTKKVTVL